MADQVIGVTIKGIGDFSDVVSNVGAVQKALTKLKLPDKLGDNLSKNISNFMKEYEKYQKKVAIIWLQMIFPEKISGFPVTITKYLY